jgi:hypothetical protein
MNHQVLQDKSQRAEDNSKGEIKTLLTQKVA